MLSNEYPVFTQELGTGLVEGYSSMTPYNAALQNNGARNPLGALWFNSSFSQGGSLGLTAGGGPLSSQVGYASGLWMRYVLYKSTANPAVQTGPAVVYYTDETFTTVSGQQSEGFVSSASAIAGWLLPNSGTLAGYGAGTTNFTATLLNNGGNGSYVWIGLQGFIRGAAVSSATIGQAVYGSGNFAVTGIADGSNLTHRIAGYLVGAASGNIADIVATCDIY